MSGAALDPNPERSDRVVSLLCERVFIENDEQLIERLMGALSAVLRATGEPGARAFEEYCERLGK